MSRDHGNRPRLDWARPIAFENGERCQLVATYPNGAPNFKDCTRVVERLDVDTSTLAGAMTSIWYFKEDGRSNWPGYNVVNAA